MTTALRRSGTEAVRINQQESDPPAEVGTVVIYPRVDANGIQRLLARFPNGSIRIIL